ncbi:MAG: 2-oxoacid:ferredoxin oxidoreductase subunit beta [Deltaproteobacteria bacterium]|nr:2-oxoacid:ferredoxin oxidoreductase subunit beta [Deltaproteobacteria bacterium]
MPINKPPTNKPIDQANTKLTRKDFLSNVDPRWCLGCGCYSIFGSLTRVFPELGIPKEKFAIISGIGCSSRLPYYSSAYGFHTIHGRAATVAFGLKRMRPDLSVWVMTGDGDALSIGGNHFIHLMRRNADIKVILFNNQIYGLTKGQTSPTSALGVKTKTTPYGSIDSPLNPLALAIAAGATFAARVTDADPELLYEAILGAAKHHGVAFVEVMLNCVIFNDGAFDSIIDKNLKADTTIRLKHGEPLAFGKERNKGIHIGLSGPEIVDGGDKTRAIATHDVHLPDASRAYALALMSLPNTPVPVGIFRQVQKTVYAEGIESKVPSQSELERLLKGQSAWVREQNGSLRSLESD